MPNRLPLRGLYMATCLALVGAGLALWILKPTAGRAASAEIEPAARQLLDAVAAAYRTLPAYSDQGKFTVAVTVNEQPQTQSDDVRLAFERPDKLALTAGGVRVASDGETILTSQAAVKKYMTQPAPERLDLAKLLTGPLGAVLLGHPVQIPMTYLLAFLIDENPVERLTESASTVTVEADREVDGQARHVVLLKPATGPLTRLLIDPKTKLIWRVELDIPADELEAKAPPGTKLSNFSIAWESGSISTEPPAADTFAATPPPGFTEVKAAEAKAESGENPDANPMLGKPAPDFKFTLLEGDREKPTTKADLKGKVTLIDFWATWCPPCRQELPEIRDLAASLAKNPAQADKVAVIALSEDQEDGDVRKLVTDTLKDLEVSALLEGPVSRVGLDPDGSVGDAFGVRGIPMLVLLDAEGVVQKVVVGYRPGIGDELREDIQSLLDGKPLVADGAKAPDASKPR